MSLEIKPLANIIELGVQSTIAIKTNQYVHQPAFAAHLHARHLLGVLARHSGKESSSFHAVVKARNLDRLGTLGVFVLNSAEDFVGLATVDPSPSLRRQLVSLPPRFAVGPLSRTVPLTGPEVTAWINPFAVERAEELLTETYKELKDPTGLAEPHYRLFAATHERSEEGPIQAWTIEPLDAPGWIHKAIRKAGFQHTAGNTGVYDDGESRRVSPPQSKLYVAQ